MTSLAAAIDPPRPTRLAVSARSAILAGVLALHAAAIVALLTGAGAALPPMAERTLAVFDVAPPPPPPPPDPPAPPPARAADGEGSPPLRRPPSTPDGGSPKPPPAQARAPDYAPVPRQVSFDVTLAPDAAPIATGAAPLPGLADAGALGPGGIGTGTGRGGGGGGLRFGRARWIYQPGRYEMMRYFPAAARKAAVSGQVLLSCDVPTTGRPKRCQSIAENPADHGFGAAAVQMAALFRIRPVLRNGRPMTEVPIIIPVVFELEGKPLPARPPCPPPHCAPVPGYRRGLER